MLLLLLLLLLWRTSLTELALTGSKCDFYQETTTRTSLLPPFLQSDRTLTDFEIVAFTKSITNQTVVLMFFMQAIYKEGTLGILLRALLPLKPLTLKS